MICEKNFNDYSANGNARKVHSFIIITIIISVVDTFSTAYEKKK